MVSMDAMRSYVGEAWKARGWNVERIKTMPDDQVLAVYRKLKSEPVKQKYVAVLGSPGCWCGDPKERGNAVCIKCFFKLPQHLRKPLYCKIGHGFEKAYDRALQFLKRKQNGGG